MLQSKGKGAEKQAASVATQATQLFATEPRLLSTPIVVGDSAHTSSRRVHDSTLLGMAPPPVYAPAPVIVQTALPAPAKVVSPAQLALAEHLETDDRRLATVLVFGTLIAMFAIALSASPEPRHTGGAPMRSAGSQAAPAVEVALSPQPSAAPVLTPAQVPAPAKTIEPTPARTNGRSKSDGKVARRHTKPRS